MRTALSIKAVTVSLIFLLFHIFPLDVRGEGKIGPPAKVMEMTVSDSILVALRNSRAVKSSYLDRITQKYDLKAAEDKFVPKPSVSVESKRATSTSSSAISTSASAAVSETIPTGGQINLSTSTAVDNTKGDTNNSWSVTLSQPVLRGGGIDVTMASVRTARISEEQNILSLKSSLMDTVTAVITAYRSFLQATKEVEISRQSLERAKELVSVNKDLIAAGRMAEVDLVQTEADVASREFSLLQSENSADAARLSLINLLDIDRHTIIVPTEKIAVEPAQLDYEQCIKTAFENRPDYLRELMSLETSRISLMLAKNNRLWDLSLYGEYGGSSSSGPSAAPGAENWSAGVKLTIPLRDLSLDQGYLSSKISLEKAELNLTELRETIEVKVQDALRDVDTKWRQVKIAQQSRLLSEKKLEIETEKMKAGRSSNFQLVSFQNDLVNAQNSEIGAVISYLNAITSLDQTLGTTLEKWNIEIDERFGDEYVKIPALPGLKWNNR